MVDPIKSLWLRPLISDTKNSEEPHRYEELKGPLRGIRSYHSEYRKTEYRIAYRILENKNQIEVVMVKSRESFYQTLRRISR